MTRSVKNLKDTIPVSGNNIQSSKADGDHEGDGSTDHHQADGVEAGHFMEPFGGGVEVGCSSFHVMKGRSVFLPIIYCQCCGLVDSD